MAELSEHHDDAHAGHGHAPEQIDLTKEETFLGERAWPVYNMAKIAGFVGIIGGVLLGYFLDPGFRRFYFAYLISFMFFLSIALGALIFVLLQHLTRAGWSVSVRRSAEGLAASMPILFALSAPIIVSVIIQRGDLYRWAQPVSHRADTMHIASEHPEPEHPKKENVVEEQGAAGGNQGTMGHPPVDTHADKGAASNVPPLDELTLAKR